MGAFLSYSLLSGLILLALYLAYRMFLSRDNQHSFNRGVLLGIYIVSFTAFPAINALEALSTHSAAGGISLEALEATAVAGEPTSAPIWGTVLIWIYVAGMAAVAGKTLITWLQLSRLVRRGTKIKRDGYTLVIIDSGRFAPFSWMRYMVVSRADYENDLSAIATHELRHIALNHWIDLLVAQAVCIANWLNPAAWLMRDELMLIHEYQADMAVIDSGHNPQEYQMLLIKKAVGARFPSLANSLNHSKLKKRITMMYKEKSGAGRKFRALALVPVLALAIGVASVPAIRAAATTIGNSGYSVDKGSEKTAKKDVSIKVYQVSNISDDGTGTTVTINGSNLGSNLSVSGGTCTAGGTEYKANQLSTTMTDGMATIKITFPCTGNKEISNLSVIINGDKIPFNLEQYRKDNPMIVVGEKTDEAKKTTIVQRGISAENAEEPTILVDGKEIPRAEMEKMDPGTIASIKVDRQKNTIEIISKKKK